VFFIIVPQPSLYANKRYAISSEQTRTREQLTLSSGREEVQNRVSLSVFEIVANGEEVMRLAEVRLQEGESLENALRRFKRKVQQEDIIKDVKRHSFYLKPGEKKRVKEALARKRARKKSRKESD
jgi:small subunit ribosomal protein S21